MAEKLDYAHLGFAYHVPEKRYVSNYRNGAWDKGCLSEDSNVVLNESAGILQYCQQVFEGMKAYRWKDGSIVCFRPDLNAERMFQSAAFLEMPSFPVERFLSALDEVVRANADSVPPYGTGASLYIRPYLFASGIVIGVQPAEEYQFRIFTTPVGPYFKGGATPIALMVSDFDRAAPHGTGAVKAGLNYAMSLHSHEIAKKKGFAENIYLDAAKREFVEETGGANILFVDREGQLVVPKSDSILPSITRKSLIYVAKEMLHIPVVERQVRFAEVPDFVECGLCGTAAVISPVGKIVDHDREILFPSGMEKPGKITAKLYETLSGIQNGEIPAPEGWIRKIL
jgi:branched-chain-amino-acid transaminase